MPRARNIKPGFFKNEDLGELSFECRLLFIGLWTLADRDGRLECRPKRIRAEVFPYDDIDSGKLQKLLEDLGAARVIDSYEVDGRRIIQITNWAKHQHPHKNETPSDLPPPSESPEPVEPQDDTDDSSNYPSTSDLIGTAPADSLILIPDSLNKNSSELGEPASEPTSFVFLCRGKQKEWALTKAKLDEYHQSFPGINVESEMRMAVQWCRDNATKRKTANGMPAFLSRWLAKVANRAVPQKSDVQVMADDTYRKEQQRQVQKSSQSMAIIKAGRKSGKSDEEIQRELTEQGLEWT